jgi:iron complex transport system substrate-binding protein
MVQPAVTQSRSIEWRRVQLQSLVGFALLMLPSCTIDSPPPPPPPAIVTQPNRPAKAACVETYEPDRDYFPVKTQVQYAKGFAVEYHKNYKKITILNPWNNAKETFSYLLVQCGTPTPKGYKPEQVITVPINSIAVTSTTHLAQLEALNQLDRLVGFSNPDLIYGDAIKADLVARKVATIGADSTINIEQLIALNPDIISIYGLGDASDSQPKLKAAGLRPVLQAEYMETHPLGRTEWFKTMAMFFNQEAEATQLFDRIVQNYQWVASQAQAARSKPTVLTDAQYQGTWYVAGGKSYVAQYLKDAGANYLWADNDSTGSVPLSFETVYAKGRNADVWLNVNQDWKTLDTLLKADERYANFKPVKTGRIYNNNGRMNDLGSSDYWQSGLMHPDVILADLATILHPGLLGDRPLVYYRPLVVIPATTTPSPQEN